MTKALYLSTRISILVAFFAFSLESFSQVNEGEIRRYLNQSLTELGIGEKDLKDIKISHVNQGGQGQFEVAYVQQTKNGIEIHNRIVNVIYAKGRAQSFSGNFAANLYRDNINTTPGISPAQGLASAARSLRLNYTNDANIIEAASGSDQKGLIESNSLSTDEIPFRLVYQDKGKEGLILCWEYAILENSGLHWWQIRVDASNGKYVDKNDWIANCKFGGGAHVHGPSCTDQVESNNSILPSVAPIPNAYNVFAMPIESPSHGTRSNQVTPWLAGTSSPFGWHDTNGAPGAEFTITRGNNVHASEDQDADNNPGFSPDGGANLDFDFPLDLANAPSTYIEAAVTNLFYWNNICHDVFYNYGFDEASGNFQENNYGNGGLGGDYVNADALDGSGVNNANFGTPPDGFNPRMQMFEFDITTPNVTSDLDNGVIIHEYGHGISNRLTAGPQNVSCLFNAEQMGEGWSDYLGLMLTMEPGDVGSDNRGIGTYVIGQPTSGNGIRQYPYSTDLGINPHTYADVNSVSVPHGVGSIWCAMLWDMTWLLIDQYGFDPDIYNGTGGNNIALQLVMDGMKLQACEPGFVDGRDAILLADQINNGGANQCLIWEAFARRGLGAGADQGSSNNLGDGVVNFDEPCSCQPNPGVLGCTDPLACNFDPLADCNDFSCIPAGCTDPAACNFNPDAGCDDGSCLLDAHEPTFVLTTDCWGNEVSWEIQDDQGNTIVTNPISYGNQTTYTWVGCLPDDACYTFIIYDSYGDGLNGTAFGCSTNGSYEMYNEYGELIFDMGPNPDYGTQATHAFCLSSDPGDIEGCTDPTACNYNEFANIDDGSCILPPTGDTCSDAVAVVVDGPTINATNSNTCLDGPDPICGGAGIRDTWFSFVYNGGEISIAANLGTLGDTRLALYDGCGGTLVACNDDSGGLNSLIEVGCDVLNLGQTYYIQAGGWTNLSGDFTIDVTSAASPLGCTDTGACNYDPAALCDDGSCEFVSCSGCTNATACNYDATATIDDGSCEFSSCAGCTNPAACNYDATASIDDGNCDLVSCYGCTDPSACNYDATATNDDGSCEFTSCAGCTNPSACNFDSAATIDDGSCDLGNTYFEDLDGDGFGNAAVSITACSLPTGYSILDTDCDDTNNNMYPGAPSTQEGIDNDCDGFVNPDEEAPCMGDFNEDGNRNVADLLMLLGEIGCTGSGCNSDMNNDGSVNSGDMVGFLGIYGTDCP